MQRSHPSSPAGSPSNPRESNESRAPNEPLRLSRPRLLRGITIFAPHQAASKDVLRYPREITRMREVRRQRGG